MTEEAYQTMCKIFPDGLEADSQIFTRHLESIRLMIVETIYSLRPDEFECALKDQISCKGMENFLRCRADPNTLCGPVKEKGGRSALSAVSLFLVFKDKVKDYLSNPRYKGFNLAGIRRTVPEIDNCIKLLQRKGGRGIRILESSENPKEASQTIHDETLTFVTAQEELLTFYTALGDTQYSNSIKAENEEEATQLLCTDPEDSQKLDPEQEQARDLAPIERSMTGTTCSTEPNTH